MQDIRPDISPVPFLGYQDDDLTHTKSGKSSLIAALNGPSMRSSIRLSTAQMNLQKRETLKLKGQLSEAQVKKVNELLEDMLRNGIDFSSVYSDIRKTQSLILKGEYS